MRVGAIAAVLVAVAVAVPLADAHGTGTGTTTIRLYSRETGETKIDTGRRGPSPGDTELATDRLYRGDGKGPVIGHDVATFTSYTADVSDVRGSFILPHGTIVVGGAVTFGKPITVAVIGGTGAYSGARGTLALRGAGPSAARLIFRLGR